MTRPGEWRDEAHDYRDLLDRVKRLEMAQFGSAPVSESPVLPPTPVGGREFSYKLPDGGRWLFYFNQSTGLWDFAGGPPMVSIPTIATWTGRSVSTYQQLTEESSVAEPSVAVPFEGQYLVEFSGRGGSDINGTTVSLGLSVNGATPSTDADTNAVTAAANQYVPFHRCVPAQVLAKDDVLTLRGKGSGTGWGFFSRLAIVVKPVYVTG